MKSNLKRRNKGKIDNLSNKYDINQARKTFNSLRNLVKKNKNKQGLKTDYGILVRKLLSVDSLKI